MWIGLSQLHEDTMCVIEWWLEWYGDLQSILVNVHVTRTLNLFSIYSDSCKMMIAFSLILLFMFALKIQSSLTSNHKTFKTLSFWSIVIPSTEKQLFDGRRKLQQYVPSKKSKGYLQLQHSLWWPQILMYDWIVVLYLVLQKMMLVWKLVMPWCPESMVWCCNNLRSYSEKWKK